MKLTSVSICLFACLTSFAIFDSKLEWAGEQTIRLKDKATTEISMKGTKAQYLRMVFPSKCGSLGFGVFATGKDFTPHFVFDRDHVEYNPATTTYYFFTREDRPVELETLWFADAKVPSKGCDVKLSTAVGSVETCGDGPKIFVEGYADGKGAGSAIKDLAWNRTVWNATVQCGHTKVCRVPGTAQCRGTASAGSHWTYHCRSWFVCDLEK